MAELPERTVLKEILIDLKEKTIRSKSRVDSSQIQILRNIADLSEKAFEIFKKNPKNVNAKTAWDLINMLYGWVTSLLSQFNNAYEDLNIYAKSIEKYSAKLDATLYSAIEEAKQKVEEELKKQNEEKTESYIK